ncbi:MAG: ATP-binding protein [Bacilli bacterium]
MPLKNMEYLCSSLTNETNTKTLKEGILLLSNMVKRLDFLVNNVMNVSSLDAQKLNIIEKKYNLKKVCEEIVKRVSIENKSNIKFKYSLPLTDLYLYGDDLKIKQILYSLLTNSLEKTKEEYVEFKVNTIEKVVVARIIFNISDSGPGIEIDKINDILSSTGSLDKEGIELLNKKEVNVKLCQKVIKLMGGNLMIKSDLGKGTEFILTLDQRVYHDENKSTLSIYENIINDYRKALVVSQNKKLINKIKKVLNKNDISYSILYYGMDAVDKIKANKKYDFILISDDLKEVSGISTLKEMQKIKGFNIPSIIMLDEDKKQLIKHFLEDGFNDYIINEDIENGLNKIIEKY